MLNRKRDIARAVADGYISHSPIIFLSPLGVLWSDPRPRNPFGSSHRDGPKPLCGWGFVGSDSSDLTNPISGFAGEAPNSALCCCLQLRAQPPFQMNGNLHSLLFAHVGLSQEG